MDRREVDQKWYQSFDEKHMEFTISDADGNDIQIPAEFEICGTCNGKGSHVNPSIDSQGLSQEDFEQDPDFQENYFSGMYDVPCNECHGKRVSPTVAWDRLIPEMKKYVEAYIDEHYNYQYECYRERLMGY